jgi:photosystem II stability/assembly factor-like uncharacterized protein
VLRRAFAIASLLLAPSIRAQAPTLSPALKWRSIGPFRGGRTKAATGVPSQPSVFYIGAVNGGVWKTNDYGRTWAPLFDEQPTSSIGALEVALSDPNTIYVGSGEGLQRPDLSTGDGMYKSTDAGKTWAHLGLRDGWQIARIAIDPTNASRLFVAVLGHPYGANTERGIFRSTNGGQSFENVLYKDENTGGVDVQFAPNDPNTVYAVLWETRLAPWENGQFSGPGSGLFKSIDGGTTWHQLTKGLPTFAEGLNRIQIAPSPSDPNRLYANIYVSSGAMGGVYRSDDAGESWMRATADERIWGRGDDFTPLTVDPKNAEIVYAANVVTWKSIDGGKTWNSLRGAPGGDDYQRLWINPNDTKTMLLVSDQGAVITVNGGESWSSWYNQSTAQFYHVTADNAFPYRLCGGQQESGSACVSSRGNDGSIGYREWHPVGTEEYGYVAPDPLDPDIVYGDKVARYDRRTGQTAQVGPNVIRRGGAPAKGAVPYRVIRTEPIMFSPTNPHKLYFTSNVVWQTTNGGESWTAISGDLSRETWEVPKNVGTYAGSKAAAPSRRGVVYALAPSPVDSNTIWAGTDDGLIWVTRNDGRSWANVSPPALVPWAKVSIIDASHFDANEAYAAVNTIRLDDQSPHIYRTKDGGKTWTEITAGIAGDASVNVVREDTKRRGLLFAGTETQVWYSLDDGDHWNLLRLNMPAQSIRDLIIKDDDVALATHGRGFWILDDISPLRQWTDKTAAEPAVLFKPQPATRVRYSMYTDTPVPPDESMAENPPDGAIIDYYLAKDQAGPVIMEIENAAGRVVRRFSSDDKFDAPKDVGNWPWYWFRPLSPLGTKAGLQRYVWDLHFAPPPVSNFSLPISATPRNTLKEPEGPWAQPGEYTVKLTAGGNVYKKPLTVRMDPRVRTPAAEIARQYALSVALYDAVRTNAQAMAQVKELRAQLKDRRAKTTGALQADIDSLDVKAAGFGGQSGGGFLGGGGGGADSFGALQAQLLSVLGVLQSADIPPTAQAVAAAADRQKALQALRGKWDVVLRVDVPALNAQLKNAGMEPVKVSTMRIDVGQSEAEGSEDEP